MRLPSQVGGADAARGEVELHLLCASRIWPRTYMSRLTDEELTSDVGNALGQLTGCVQFEFCSMRKNMHVVVALRADAIVFHMVGCATPTSLTT